MAKVANVIRHTQMDRDRWVIVHTDLSHELAGLLRGSGGRHEGLVHQLFVASDPHQGKANNSVRYSLDEARMVAEDLEALLGRTPPGAPGRDGLVRIGEQLGVREAAAEPTPAPTAEVPVAPAPAPALSRPPAA